MCCPVTPTATVITTHRHRNLGAGGHHNPDHHINAHRDRIHPKIPRTPLNWENDFARHPAGVQAIALVDSATALADLDEPEKANTDLARARGLWQPTSADTHGDLDRPAAILELERGHLDAAEPFAVASVRRWEGVSQNGHTNSCVVLATIHVQAGDANGLRLAHSAISATNKLTSVRVRRRLVPLADALDARTGSDAKQLARMARQVASTRA